MTARYVLALATFALFFILAAGTQAQEAKPVASAWKAPQTTDGQPDIQGYWAGTGGIGAAFDIELGVPADENKLQQVRGNAVIPHVISEPADGKIPYQPWAAAVRDENRKNSLYPTKLEHLDSLSRCLQMGIPRQSFLGGFQIFQSPGYVVSIQGNASRTIPVDGRPHIPSNIKLWAGDSVGHWEGNTFVVDVTNINEHGFYDWAGNFHSNELHLVERWNYVDADTIDYEARSYDPKVFTSPWTLKNQFKRNKKKEDAEIFEDACYEGERDVDVMLHHESSGSPK